MILGKFNFREISVRRGILIIAKILLSFRTGSINSCAEIPMIGSIRNIEIFVNFDVQPNAKYANNSWFEGVNLVTEFGTEFEFSYGMNKISSLKHVFSV